MEIINIIKNTCVFLQKDELLETTELGGEETSTEAQQREISLLLRCLNLVYNSIATDYIPLIKTEIIMPINGEILFTSLSEKILDIKRIEDKYGLRLNYKLYPDRILTIDGEVTINYSYEPEELEDLTSTMESFSEKLTERVIAYGVAMEYSFISGLHDDASIWEKRFKDSLQIASRKKAEMRLPSRRWN
ncbi:MAG: hypothetical protein PHS54_02265 [Clostridia bacterium]|nr:hypothetical protein [Clostridia bacterium]